MDGNENIYHINCIEGLVSGISAEIELIKPNYPRAQIAKEQLIADINDIQIGSLYELRTLCEGDKNEH